MVCSHVRKGHTPRRVASISKHGKREDLVVPNVCMKGNTKGGSHETPSSTGDQYVRSDRSLQSCIDGVQRMEQKVRVCVWDFVSAGVLCVCRIKNQSAHTACCLHATPHHTCELEKV